MSHKRLQDGMHWPRLCELAVSPYEIELISDITTFSSGSLAESTSQ